MTSSTGMQIGVALVADNQTETDIYKSTDVAKGCVGNAEVIDACGEKQLCPTAPAEVKLTCSCDTLDPEMSALSAVSFSMKRT